VTPTFSPPLNGAQNALALETPARPRVLILTAGFGEGHNAAARALASAFNRIGGPDTGMVSDPFALASPRLNSAARAFYIGLINRAPQLWSRVYDWIDRSNFVQRRIWLFRREIRVLTELIARERPTAICSTYPLYSFFLQVIAQQQPKLVPTTFTIVTDSISINSLWWRAPSDGWFLPNEDSAVVLRKAGVDPSAVHVSGFPVPAFFSDNASLLSPPEINEQNSPRVLHVINSGTRNAEETARRLLTETDWTITCAVGRDRKLRERLLQVAADRKYPAQILGWTDQIPHLLMTHHVVVSKAGGATTQESIAALCPMIVSQVVPGQEEGNYELLRRHSVGALAQTPDAVLAELRGAFADHGRIWRQWRAALRPLAAPDAANDIARHVLSAVTDRASEGVRR
jgi:processive 1,2-diacylglycerol beta-glucosyltransferase